MTKRLEIDDAMAERWLKAWNKSLFAKHLPAGMIEPGDAKFFLYAALERRTGPKDRRVEWDDTGGGWRYLLRPLRAGYGRRETDRARTLPLKSDRLKRESEERAKEEIPVSEGMDKVAIHTFLARGMKGISLDDCRALYRAMEKVRREEAGENTARSFKVSLLGNCLTWAQRRHGDGCYGQTPPQI